MRGERPTQGSLHIAIVYDDDPMGHTMTTTTIEPTTVSRGIPIKMTDVSGCRAKIFHMKKLVLPTKVSTNVHAIREDF